MEENKLKIIVENNPCVNEGEDYYPELVPSFTILFATETGTAEEFANQLHKEANEKLRLKADIINVSQVKSVEIFNENSLIVIIASTWGEGGPTDDCEDFNKMLEDQKFWDGFKNKDNLNIAIFGLGSKSYTYFNAQAKFFHKKFIEEHEIKELCTMGLGDSNKDIEKDFNDWKDKVFYKSLYSFYSKNFEKNEGFYKENGLLNILSERINVELSKDFKLYELIISDKAKSESNTINQCSGNHINIPKAKIIKIEELRQNNTNGSTLKVVFDLSGTNLKYKPAENILIYPKNSTEAVKEIINFLGISGKENNFISYNISNTLSLPNIPLPEGITVKEALSEYIDLSSQIHKGSLINLINHLTDASQRVQITNIFNNEKLMKEFLSKRYNILDFIKEFNSLKLTFQDLADILPTILPRFYTCSSSNNKKNNTIELVISLVSWKGPKGDKRYGLTSNYFNELYKSKSYLEKDEFVHINLRESNFTLPEDLSTPMLMMCTGSGIAPFISFLEELEIKKSDKKYETYLIYGAMNKKNDFIFEKELEEFKKNGILTEYYTAFSRDQENKIYVQNIFEKEFGKEKLEKLVFEKGMKIYICGSNSMGKAVIQKLREIVGQEGEEKIMINRQLMCEMWENK